MFLKTFKPTAPLREFVEFFRLVHFQFDGTQTPVKYYPPRPEHCLSFYPFGREEIYYDGCIKKVEVPAVMLNGQQTHVTKRLIKSQHFLILHIIFQPTALFRLTGIPVYEFNNKFLDAQLIFGSAVADVNNALSEAVSYEQMINIAEQFVSSAVSKRCHEAHALDLLCSPMNGWPRVSVQESAGKSYLSTRQLQRKFRERTGLTPKLFERTTRFHQSIDLMLKNPSMSWVSIAYQCGYCDYQHLAKEYLDFTGMTPTAYKLVDNQSPERQFGFEVKSYNENKEGYLV